MSEVQETGTRRQINPNRFRIISIVIACLMFAGAFGVFVGPFTNNASATITGDTYSGSGDWIVDSDTVYTGETLTIYGNISIEDGANLTLSNTVLTVNCPAGGASVRKINISTVGFPTTSRLQLSAGSTIKTTNATLGGYNLQITTGGSGYMLVDNSILENIRFNMYAYSQWSYIRNSTLKSYLQMYNARVMDCVIENSISAHNFMFSNVQNGYIMRCTFKNLTQTTRTIATDSAIQITSGGQHLRFEGNTFETLDYQAIYLTGSGGQTYNDISISNNRFLAVPSSSAGFNRTVIQLGGVYVDSTALKCDGNRFDRLENGTRGILVSNGAWTLNANRFDWIDARALTSSASAGIWVDSHTGISQITNTTVLNVYGPLLDIGGMGDGVFCYNTGGVSISHSIIKNVTYTSNGIAFSIGSGTDITVHANNIDYVANASNAIGMFAGDQSVISWNNISRVDSSSAAIRVCHGGTGAIVHNNSVSNNLVTTVSNPGMPGIFTADGETNPLVMRIYYYDNRVSGTTTPGFPDYNVTIRMAGGSEIGPGVNVVIRPGSSPAMIRAHKANVTITNDGGDIFSVTSNGVRPTTYLNGPISITYVNATGAGTRFTNVTTTGLRIITVNTGTLALVSWDTTANTIGEWNLTSTGTVTFTLSGLESGRMYRLYIDGEQDLLLTASGNGVISFTYSGPWSEHQFEIVATSVTGSISGLVNLIFIMFAIGIVVGVMGETVITLRKEKVPKVETLINMVIYIIIGMASLGVLYSIVT